MEFIIRSRDVSPEVFIIKMNNLKNKLLIKLDLIFFYQHTNDLGCYERSIIPLSMYFESGANNSWPEVIPFEDEIAQ